MRHEIQQRHSFIFEPSRYAIAATAATAAIAAIVCLLSAAIPAQELTLDRILNAPQTLLRPLPSLQWMPGGSRFTQLHQSMEGDKVQVTEAKTLAMEWLFDASQMQKAFAAAGFARLDGKRIPPGFSWIKENVLRLRTPQAVYHWDVTTEKATLVVNLPKGAGPVAFGPGDEKVAFIKDMQLWIQAGKGEPTAITKDGSDDVVYGGPAHRSEFGIHDGLWWGPKGRYLAFYREDLSPIDIYPYVDHTKLPPVAVHGRYPMAGRANSHVRVGIYDTERKKLYYLQEDKEKDVYWTNVSFEPEGKNILVAIVNRAQNHMDLVRFDLLGGIREAVIFSEDDKEWIEPEYGPIFLPDRTGRFLWFSPRNGRRHLYHYNAEGLDYRKVTGGSFDVLQFLAFADGGKRAFVMGSGSDPRQMHLWLADLETGALQRVTQARGRHSCDVSSDGAYIIDRYSNLTNPGTIAVIDRAGEEVFSSTRKNTISNLGQQEFFDVKADDGTTLHGHLILPPGLDEKKKYPVILYVYGGPHSQLVTDRWLGGADLWLQFMATKGFIICRLDGRGTDNRGIEFSQAVFRQLGLLEVRDQLKAIEFLEGKSYVDGKRIGVHGWSYGGYMTLSLMLRAPEVFACGAGGAPVTDWAQYETGYTERYMDTPAENPEGYKKACLIPLAGKLKGRLLILHGTADDTVMWSHSLAFVDRCIDEGVLVDYMPYPMQKHGLRGQDRKHMYKLLTRFFLEQLKP